jgi:hypothetical protein
MADAGGNDVLDGARAQAVERLHRLAAAGLVSAEQLDDRLRRVQTAMTRAGIDQSFVGLPDEPSQPPSAGWAPIDAPPPAPSPPLDSRSPAAPGPTALQPPRPRQAGARRQPTRRTQVLAVFVVLLLVGLFIATAIGSAVPPDPGDEVDGAGESAVASTTPRPAIEEPASTSPTTTVPAPSPGQTDTPPSTILERPDFHGLAEEDPRLTVGQHIRPGRYLSESRVWVCYWERLSGLGGTDAEIIANGFLPGGHVIVDVLPSDVALASQGCSEWQAYVPPATPVTTFTDGDWLVGSDVPPGRYRALNGNHGPVPCFWERASGFAHTPDEVLAYDRPGTNPLSVELHAGERFTTDSCGYWTLID